MQRWPHFTAGLALAATILLCLQLATPPSPSPATQVGESPREIPNDETAAPESMATPSEAPLPLQDMDEIPSGPISIPAEKTAALGLLGVAQHSPGTALDGRHRLTDPGMRLQTLDTIMADWATRSFLEALDYAATLEDKAERETALSAALRGQAEGAPKWTLDLGSELLGPSYAFDRLAFTVLQSWSQTSPRDALNWAAGNLEPALRNQAFGTFLRSWAEENPDEAIAWVSALTVSGVKQEALQALGAL